MHIKNQKQFLDNAEDLDIAMPMHNMLKHSHNYSVTSGNVQNYYSDEVNDNANEIVANYGISNNKTAISI